MAHARLVGGRVIPARQRPGPKTVVAPSNRPACAGQLLGADRARILGCCREAATQVPGRPARRPVRLIAVIDHRGGDGCSEPESNRRGGSAAGPPPIPCRR